MENSVNINSDNISDAYLEHLLERKISATSVAVQIPSRLFVCTGDNAPSVTCEVAEDMERFYEREKNRGLKSG